MRNMKFWRTALVATLVLTVMLSVTGGTIAWFTDSVTSESNIIKSGTLDIEMFWAEGKEEPNTVTWNDASEGAIFDYSLWEPGYVQARHVKIENVGNLALKYDLKIEATGAVSDLADVIDVYYIDSALKLADRGALVDGIKIGTLASILANNGSMNNTAAGHLNVGEKHTVTIALKMQESAGNEYQNKAIGSSFALVLTATQDTVETDSFDDQYDSGAELNSNVTYVPYDAAKTAKENGEALQAALNAASEGDTIVLGAGTYSPKDIYTAFTIKTDNVTLAGVYGTVLEHTEECRNSLLDVHGDNVSIRNITFNKNKQTYNQLILNIGAENLTVTGCTFYGENYQGGNTPTMGIYIFENLDSTGEAGDPITKYTIANNTFNGAAVGTYKGSKTTVPSDPGVQTAQVSADMQIKSNTFVDANILIENWRSWSKEANRDHKYVPTITGNTFVSPNLCFANTPHSIYLRCYRQGNPGQILPVGYIDAFVANNTVATPANDTVVTYNGADYVLSDNYGTFFRDNATYGTIAYCYGQTYEEK